MRALLTTGLLTVVLAQACSPFDNMRPDDYAIANAYYGFPVDQSEVEFAAEGYLVVNDLDPDIAWQSVYKGYHFFKTTAIYYGYVLNGVTPSGSKVQFMFLNDLIILVIIDDVRVF